MCVDLALDAFILGCRLDDDVHRRQIIHVGGAGDFGERRVAFLIGYLLAGDEAGERAVDRCKCCLDPVRVQIVNLHPVACEGGNMRDAAAHLTCADDADILEGHNAYSIPWAWAHLWCTLFI
ncbi:hypothetical protein D3C73_622410 [compost metagenome]